MKFDYRPRPLYLETTKIRSPYVGLIGLGLLCLIMVFSSERLYLQDAQDQSTPQVDSFVESLSIPTNIAKIEKKLEEKLSSNPASNPTTKPLQKESTWKIHKIQNGDSISSVFSKIGISDQTLHKILNTNEAAKTLSAINPGQVLKYQLDDSGKLNALSLQFSLTDRLNVLKQDNTFVVKKQKKTLDTQLAFSGNTIQGSLSHSAQKAGLNYTIIQQLTDIFGWDIDFALDLQPQDQFKIIYEEKYLDEAKVKTGHILAAEFANKGKIYRAIRYSDPSGTTGYYSPEGYSMQQAFMRTPVKFTRISGRFRPARHHPILHRIRAHKGVDYAAPAGTPVKAVGNAKVEFKGWKNGYGRVIILNHGRGYSTLYAHLSKFSKTLSEGCSVKQGEVIGYVGSSGLATGPHLHYEFRIHGIHRNPLTVKLPRSNHLDEKYKTDFQNYTEKMLKLLNHPKKFQLAMNDQIQLEKLKMYHLSKKE